MSDRARRFVPAGTYTDGSDPVAFGPDDAGWAHCGLRVIELAAGEERELTTGETELFVLPLSATGLTITMVEDGTDGGTGSVGGGEVFAVEGRTSVFARVTDFVYVGRRSRFIISSASGGEVALPSARCERALPPKYGPAADVAVETRGAGPATRQVTNFASPEAWDHADRIMCVELLTPDGNWSSYPPHKHDDSPECPVNNEEAYYFRIGRAGTTDYDPTGFGMHRTYRGERPDLGPDSDFADDMAVRDGDVYLIPRGYHGPCIAAPGYTMYYLNILAGPGGERSMAFCDDPAHHWVRDEWEGMPTDPRCPMVTAAGPVASRPASRP